MSIVGSLCIVIRTAHPEYLGRVCECIAFDPHPLGSLVFKFPNGIQARGDHRNVRPITPPPTGIETTRPQEIAA